MRSRLFVASVLVGILFTGTQASLAGASASPAAQLSKFKALDGPFSQADNKWTNALSALSSSATVSQISKPSLAFVPALKTFDSGLQKAGFTGKIATEIADVEKLNGQLVTLLSSIKSVKSFQSAFSSLFGKYLPVQAALAKDFGIATADVVI
jgi:hypothetical protein